MNDAAGLILTILRIIMAFSLFAFLAWSLLLIWRDIRAQTDQSKKDQLPKIILAYQTDSGEHQEEQYTHPQIYIGRDPICECQISNETVSSRHARLYFDHSQWWIEDLDSRNGTFLNEIPITTSTVLTNGDHIRCGEIQLILSIEKSPIK